MAAARVPKEKHPWRCAHFSGSCNLGMCGRATSAINPINHIYFHPLDSLDRLDGLDSDISAFNIVFDLHHAYLYHHHHLDLQLIVPLPTAPALVQQDWLPMALPGILKLVDLYVLPAVVLAAEAKCDGAKRCKCVLYVPP